MRHQKMEITYTWNILNLNREVADGHVLSVDWMFSASSGDYVRSIVGSTKLDRCENEEDMIPYGDLTKDLVTQWVKNNIGENKIESFKMKLSSEIEEFYTPKTNSGIPW